MAKQPHSASFFIHCPECKREIEIDRATGRIIRHGPDLDHAVSSERFDEVLGSVRAREQRGASAFDLAAREIAARQNELEDAFGDALKKVREHGDTEKPFNPLDPQWD